MLLAQVSQVMERIEVTASGLDPLPRQLQVAATLAARTPIRLEACTA
jgi:hypothetical protein